MFLLVFVGVVGLFLVHAVAPPPAAAKPALDRAVAAQAEECDRAGRFAEAASRFHEAYALRPLPMYLYRAARAAWLANQNEEAIAAFERLLALAGVPAWLKKQAQLELAQLQAVQGNRMPVKVPVAPKPVVVAKPPPPVVVKPPLPPPTAKPASAVPLPAAPTPASVAVSPATPPIRLAIRLPDQPMLPLAPAVMPMPPAPTAAASSSTAGIAAFVVAGIAAAAAVAMGVHANTLQERLQDNYLTNTDVFDLTRTTKPVAVADTNAIALWWNGVIACGVAAAIGAGTGGMWLSEDPQPVRTGGQP